MAKIHKKLRKEGLPETITLYHAHTQNHHTFRPINSYIPRKISIYSTSKSTFFQLLESKLFYLNNKCAQKRMSNPLSI